MYESMETMVPNICFPIISIGFSKSDIPDVNPVGSAFLIDSMGTFVTVGHNFNRTSVAKFGAPNFTDFREIELFHIEYDRDLGIDLAIGKLCGYKSNAHMPKLCSAKNLEIGTKLWLCGYKSFLVDGADEISVHKYGNGLTLHKQCIQKEVIEIPKNDFALIQRMKECNGSALPFESNSEGDKLKGYSGGPVYIGPNIYGVIVSHYFITSDYIVTRLPYGRELDTEVSL